MYRYKNAFKLKIQFILKSLWVSLATLYADPPRRFAKRCTTRFVHVWDVCKDTYTLGWGGSGNNM